MRGGCAEGEQSSLNYNLLYISILFFLLLLIQFEEYFLGNHYSEIRNYFPKIELVILLFN